MALYKLSCKAQNYAWGRPAEESEVAQLSLASGQEVDPSQPYAELWMGTHPSGPSTLAEPAGAAAGEGATLGQLLARRPDLLGASAAEFGPDLPFLFKVLSVGTALSIQSHPDKALAERLHREQPQVYKDANHKPEMALALSGFEALMGFAGHAELVASFQTCPELAECAGPALVDAYCRSAPGAPRRAALRAAFGALMRCDAGAVAAAVGRMAARLRAAPAAAGRALSDKEQLVLRLHQQYPGDVGVLAAWMLNHARLAPGQAVWLAPNEPHAYLSGELIECMATSDNVIRAGLTPKLRDADLLERSLTYSQSPPEAAILNGEAVKGAPHLTLYRPPFREFELYSLRPPAGAGPLRLPPAAGPALLLVQAGSGHVRVAAGAAGAPGRRRAAGRGDVFFVGAGTRLEVEAEEGMTIWAATVNGLGFAGPAGVVPLSVAASAAELRRSEE